jgi:hypothetical protein
VCFSPNVTERFGCLDSLGRALGLEALGESSELTRVRFSAPMSARSGIARLPSALRYPAKRAKSPSGIDFLGFGVDFQLSARVRRRVARDAFATPIGSANVETG